MKNSKQNLEKVGIYKITNLINGKMYIGYTNKSFRARCKDHFDKLRSNNHKEYRHLQDAYNKYGVENFKFSIIEICNNMTEDLIVDRETYWINKLESYDRLKGYNINRYPKAAPSKTLESRQKISESIRENYRTGKMKPNNTVFKKGSEPWNKGKKYKSTDHLRVPKTVTDKTVERIENYKEKYRCGAPNILVYDFNHVYINEWRSSKDLEEFTYTNENNLPIKSRFNKDKSGIPRNVLQSVNINKACKTCKPYKNLYFKYKTASTNSVNSVNGEIPNTEPISESNFTTGVETSCES